MAGEQQLAEGELMISADGTFAVKVCLERPDAEVSLGWDGFYRYQVKVEVTDAAGETQEVYWCFRWVNMPSDYR